MSDIDLSSSISSVASGTVPASTASKSSIFSRARAGSATGSPSTTSIAKLEQSGSISSFEAVDSYDNSLNETITTHSSANRRRVRKSSSVANDMAAGRPRPMSLRLSPEEIAQQWFILEPELAESVPDAPPPGPIDIGNLSRAEIKRQETIYELYVTESDYVASMLVLQRLFIAPLAKHQVLADRERMMLFSNVEQLIPVNQ
ncbi:hypothetical protein BCR44DRAFT_1154006 [Catenaria anguillulae PL171]|uniref:DH domain-containing protein n=1 Tax=Catenaria anguillulae PL171 TaxID=765915 RepID=A0A1Y2HKV6_9FUNG|nr:hypothetical protein BCR44DRAFT_1154006 [Catenaria anguillulae PL171]